jgi:phospholipid-binding lipoprotein MlaA
MIQKLTILITTLFICCFTQPSLAQQEEELQFNFSDNYEGEDNFKTNNREFVYDPFEKVNRKIFAFNETLDQYFAEPVVREYRKRVPRKVRNSVGNFLDNLSAPISVVNSLLQGNGRNAMASFSSFLINTTIGIGGLFDIAGYRNITYNPEDFGQTFAKYGSNTGPYLVLPILGPSNVRDFSGFIVEKAVNPLNFNILKIGGKKELIHNETSLSISLSSGIDTRENLIEVLEDMRRNSFDTYATMRSAYLQTRKSLSEN